MDTKSDHNTNFYSDAKLDIAMGYNAPEPKFNYSHSYIELLIQKYMTTKDSTDLLANVSKSAITHVAIEFAILRGRFKLLNTLFDTDKFELTPSVLLNTLKLTFDDSFCPYLKNYVFLTEEQFPCSYKQASENMLRLCRQIAKKNKQLLLDEPHNMILWMISYYHSPIIMKFIDLFKSIGYDFNKSYICEEEQNAVVAENFYGNYYARDYLQKML